VVLLICIASAAMSKTGKAYRNYALFKKRATDTRQSRLWDSESPRYKWSGRGKKRGTKDPIKNRRPKRGKQRDDPDKERAGCESEDGKNRTKGYEV
jgi:hypothetical protein